MEIKLGTIEYNAFNQVIKSTEAVCEECNLIFDNGLLIKALDPSVISLIKAEIPREAFKEYNTENTIIGLELDPVLKALKTIEKDSMLELSKETEGINNKFVIKAELSTFSFDIIDINLSNMPEIPNIETDASANIDLKVLKNALKQALNFGKKITLEIKDNKAVISENGFKTIISQTVKGEALAIYPIDFINGFIKTMPVYAELKLSLKSDSPLIITAEIGKTKINFIVAPRINND